MVKAWISTKNMFQEHLLEAIERNTPPNSIYLREMQNDILTISVNGNEIEMFTMHDELIIHVNKSGVYAKSFNQLQLNWMFDAWKAIKNKMEENKND